MARLYMAHLYTALPPQTGLILPVALPLGRIVADILPNPSQVYLVAHDMIVKARLPGKIAPVVFPAPACHASFVGVDNGLKGPSFQWAKLVG